MTPFEQFVAKHGASSREAFLAAVKVPHVLMEQRARSGRDSSFLTVRLDKSALEDAQRGGRKVIAPVEKRAGANNAFAMMITVGRASNNDIVVPDQRVSKFHAYFRSDGKQWLLCDANSRNGTLLDGEAVPQQGGTPVPSGARIELAQKLELEFCDPPLLYERVQAARVS